MELAAYLDRIGYSGPLSPNAETLRALHVAHLMSVPFENLDIHCGREIRLDPEALFEKIVRQRRGGYCYELNGLFAILLEQLGFRVTRLSARVADDRGEFGPEFDHLTLLVDLGQRWLADVGFGESTLIPLPLDRSEAQYDGRTAYRLAHQGEQWQLERQAAGGAWQTQYAFSLIPRRLADFAEMNVYQQTSPESHFTQNRICTRPTPEGRVTLSGLRLIRARNGTRQETILSDERAYRAALQQEFGIVL